MFWAKMTQCGTVHFYVLSYNRGYIVMVEYKKFEVIWSKNKETVLFKCTRKIAKMGKS